jgi:hypothetical protein
MKKNITLLLFFAIGTVVFLASYRTKDISNPTFLGLLTQRSWKFEKAESLSSHAAAVINTLYDGSQYNFTTSQTYQGEFFDRPIQGTWSLLNERDLILNKGKVSEERMKIVELSEDILKVMVMEKGSSVTVTYR